MLVSMKWDGRSAGQSNPSGTVSPRELDLQATPGAKPPP